MCSKYIKYIKIVMIPVKVLGRSSSFSTYNEDLVSMDKHSDFQAVDATGFINIQAIRLKEYKRLQDKINSTE